MPSAADIAQQIQTALALSLPDLDTSIGSVAGKMIDAISQSISPAFNDQHLTDYQYDIDSMTAGTLDGFVRLFGMDRHGATFAIGTVTFGRASSTASASIAQIPVGTQVQSNTNPVIVVQTTASAVMSIGQTTIDVPVQAIVAGPNGNVAAGSLLTLLSNVSGISNITANALPLTSGAAAESDAALIDRWKTTVFRNLAGTSQMYRAMALGTDPSVTAVNVIGPRKTWVDRITISGGTSGAMSFGNPAFIYATNVFVGPSLGTSELYSPTTDFSVVLDNTPTLPAPATITINAISGGNLADGDYDIQFDYVPTYSRNNPLGTRFSESAVVNNRIDVWTNGSSPTSVVQPCKFNSTLRFTGGATDPLYYLNFETLDGINPSIGDAFTPLGYCPIIDITALGLSGKVEGTDYDIVHRTDAFGLTPTSQAGILWYESGSFPTSGEAFTVTYDYNAIPAMIQQQTESQWRLVGTDCQYHAGRGNYYKFHLAIAYVRNFDTSAVNTAIDTAISTLIAPLGFDSTLQVSDVLQAVHNVPGVDNVRFLNATDTDTLSAEGHYGIEQITYQGNSYDPIRLSTDGTRAVDLYFDDATYPIFYSTRIVVKTRTNFGAV